MFRKSLHILISLLFLFTTAGISVSAHYCGDSLMSMTVMRTPPDCCDDESCCHNETHFYQLDDDFTIITVENIETLSGIPFHNEFKESNQVDFKLQAFNTIYKWPQPPGGNNYLARVQSFLL